jgi:hypothetical protein
MDITRNLPGKLVSRAAFDPNDPSIIYAVVAEFGSGHVFRTTLSSTSWTDISPPNVDVPFNAIALDGRPATTAIYVGNEFGVLRSVDLGATWSVLDDVHFPTVPVMDLALSERAGVLRAATFGRGVFDFAAPASQTIAVSAQNGLDFDGACAGAKRTLTLQAFNVGTRNLIVNSVQRLLGSKAFTVLPNPSTPLIISPNAEVDFSVQYVPSSPAAAESAVIRLASDDPGAPFFDLMATGAGLTARIVPGGSTAFGRVAVGTTVERVLPICNTGQCAVALNQATFGAGCGDFSLVNPAFPVSAAAGSCVNLVLRFAPKRARSQSCTLSIASAQPEVPPTSLTLTGNSQHKRRFAPGLIAADPWISLPWPR